MNRKENMLAIFNHEPHDHVGNIMTDVRGVGGNSEAFENGPAGGGFDGFGLKWARTESTGGAGLPAPNSAILSDIEDWEKIKFPDLESYDWESQAKAQLEGYDPSKQLLEYGLWNGQFLRMMHLMGFENGLVALAESPEASFAFLNAITDYRIKSLDYIMKYFKPDAICLYDDVATERGTFMSPAAYKSLIAPVHKRLFEAIRERGVIPSLHVCGKCESIVEGFPEELTEAWEICQPENDLVGLAKKVGDRIAFIGGYDMIGKMATIDHTEEELRQSVRDTIDKYGPAGNYAIMPMIMYQDREKMISSMMAMSDEATKYGTDYYKRR